MDVIQRRRGQDYSKMKSKTITIICAILFTAFAVGLAIAAELQPSNSETVAVSLNEKALLQSYGLEQVNKSAVLCDSYHCAFKLQKEGVIDKEIEFDKFNLTTTVAIDEENNTVTVVSQYNFTDAEIQAEAKRQAQTILIQVATIQEARNATKTISVKVNATTLEAT